MATSTEVTVTNNLVGAIQGIAVSGLGFDIANGNVKSYLLEHERDEKRIGYLMADVGGKKEVRCWAVWVTADDFPYAAGNVYIRRYTVTIQGYYAIGTAGSGATNLRNHARSIRSEIRDLGISWTAVVDNHTDASPVTISQIDGVSPDTGSLLQAEWTYGAERRNPDF